MKLRYVGIVGVSAGLVFAVSAQDKPCPKGTHKEVVETTRSTGYNVSFGIVGFHDRTTVKETEKTCKRDAQSSGSKSSESNKPSDGARPLGSDRPSGGSDRPSGGDRPSGSDRPSGGSDKPSGREHVDHSKY